MSIILVHHCSIQGALVICDYYFNPTYQCAYSGGSFSNPEGQQAGVFCTMRAPITHKYQDMGSRSTVILTICQSTSLRCSEHPIYLTGRIMVFFVRFGRPLGWGMGLWALVLL